MSDKDKYDVVFVKCKRGSDQRTAGTSCPSKKAYKLSKDGASVVQYKCIDCGYTWSIAVGGQFNTV